MCIRDRFPRFSPFARFSCKVCANLTRKIRELESKNSRILQRFPIFFAFRSHVFRPFSYLLRLIFAQKIALSFARFSPFFVQKITLLFARFSPFARFSCKVCANLTRFTRTWNEKFANLQRFPIFFAFCSYKNRPFVRKFFALFPIFYGLFSKKNRPFVRMFFALFRTKNHPFVHTFFAFRTFFV